MRFLHTSDWHLGRTLHGQDLTEAHQLFLDHVVDLARSRQVDAVLVCGDVFDRTVPPATSIAQLQDTLRSLTAFTRVILTPGNHDSAERLGYGADFYRDVLVVRAKLEQVGTPVAVGNTVVYPLPYLDPNSARFFFAEDEPLPRTHEAVMSAALRAVDRDLVRRRADRPDLQAVVMAHGFVLGGTATDSERDISVGGIEFIPVSVLENMGYEDAAPSGGVDYFALGHLHRPQQINATVPVHYSGSPLAFSFSEATYQKVSLVVDLTAEGASVEAVPVPQKRELVTLSGTFSELTSGIHADAAEKWVRARITDAVRPLDLVSRLKEVFPHLLHVEYIGSTSSAVERHTPQSSTKNPVETICRFLNSVSGAEVTDAQSELVETMWNEAQAQK
ncbi:MAG: exonuclease SbcCD subunit D [Actinomycetaceae bacterium]|nr:exonuclease SbcCD subunit D [Actinomycetaceae bacterium]